MKILFLGDIVGKIARQALARVLPDLRKKFKADLVVANGENLAHGKGVTVATVKEVTQAGVDLLTSGNHISNKPVYRELLDANDPLVIRPANYPPGVPGRGYKILDVKSNKVVIINLMGRVFFRETLDDPFRKLDEILKELKTANPKGEQAPNGVGSQLITILDWHTEATSEKAALAWYADGRVSAVIGTHTHVPTADARILPKGTAFISDIGMVGARDSMLGVEIEGPINMMRMQLPQKFEIPESGVVQINTVYLEIDPKSGKALKIERVDREVSIDG